MKCIKIHKLLKIFAIIICIIMMISKCYANTEELENDIENGKSINEKAWSNEIKLSEMKESEIYRYTANTSTNPPEIINDTGKNCVIYIKIKDNKTYKKDIIVSKYISGDMQSKSYSSGYENGESFWIMYKSLDNQELVNLIGKNNIIFLSNYKNGDEINNIDNTLSNKYIYNDTKYDIKLTIKEKAVGSELPEFAIIEKQKLYEYDWTIDSSMISYINNDDNFVNNANIGQSENTSNSNANKNESRINSTNMKNAELPKTGTSNRIFILIICFTIGLIISIIGLIKIKNIK